MAKSGGASSSAQEPAALPGKAPPAAAATPGPEHSSPQAASVAPPPYIVLTGNPNSGKTTLFNALTGLRAKVGNYAGVTVERKEGRLLGAPAGSNARVLDLPGTYSLSPQSIDEQSLLRKPSRKFFGIFRPSTRIGDSGKGESQPCRRASSNRGFNRMGLACRGLKKCFRVQNDSLRTGSLKPYDSRSSARLPSNFRPL